MRIGLSLCIASCFFATQANRTVDTRADSDVKFIQLSFCGLYFIVQGFLDLLFQFYLPLVWEIARNSFKYNFADRKFFFPAPKCFVNNLKIFFHLKRKKRCCCCCGVYQPQVYKYCGRFQWCCFFNFFKSLFIFRRPR